MTEPIKKTYCCTLLSLYANGCTLLSLYAKCEQKKYTGKIQWGKWYELKQEIIKIKCKTNLV